MDKLFLIGILVGIALVGAFAFVTPSGDSAVPPTPAFSKINMSGGSIEAESYNDFVTFIAGTNMTITPNPLANTITFASSGGGPGGAGDNLGNHIAEQNLDMFNFTITNSSGIIFNELVEEPSTPPAGSTVLYVANQNEKPLPEIRTSNDIVLRLARDNTITAQVNETGGIIKGDVVYVTGANGANEQVGLWIADGSIPFDLIGVSLEDGADNDFIHVLTMGKISGIPTDSFTEGQTVYASAVTPGALVGTEPVHPNLRAEIGVVIRSNMNNGEILVKPLVVRGDFEGTRQASWKIGDDVSGTKSVIFRNGFDYSLQATPSADRVVTLPDKGGTVAFLDDISGSGEVNEGQNVGTGEGSVYKGKSGVFLQFKKLKQGSGIIITNGTDDLTIAVSSVPKSALPSTIVYNDQANSYTAGMKQTFGANSTTAGLRFNGVATDPSALVNGDVWRNTATTDLKARLGGTTYILVMDTKAQTLTMKTISGASNTITNIGTSSISNDAIDNTKLANMATQTFKGRTTAATGDPEDLTVTQATAMLNTFTSSLKGLAPSSGGGTTNFLRADGSWAAPPSGGGRTELSGDLTSTSSTVYTAIFTVPLTASSVHFVDFDVISKTSATTVGVQFRGRVTNAGTTGMCSFVSPSSATAMAFDNISVSTNPADTADTAELATVATPERIYCTVETDGTPGDLVLEFQSETGGSVSVLRGSSYRITVVT